MIIIKIEHLRKLWEDEKENYKTKETGTGVQNFVKKILESEDIFELREGKLKTLIEKRKNEFIYEQSTKSGKHVDFVIFINSEIRIPVEVECFTHIERGKKQLMSYQVDLERKYGILTDGFTWRFYNNQIIEKEFKIDEIFKNVSLFQSFWTEYIKPSNYYRTFFAGIQEKGLELHAETHQESFFDDITFLIKNLKNKLQIEGYFSNRPTPPREREKEATQIVYAYLIQFILYKTLVDNEFGDFSQEYKEYLKKISEYITSDRFKEIFAIIDNISNKISKNIYRPFKSEQSVIFEKIMEIYRKPINTLSDISPWLDIFVFIKKYNFKNIQNEIFGYIYENYLKEIFSDEEKGQYFTDPSIVNFMINQIGYTANMVKSEITSKNEDKLSLIDPACGSGTFLYSAASSIVNSISDGESTAKKIQDLVSNNIFGLDIEEFPLYLAEMSTLMRLLPFIINEKFNNPFEKKIKVFTTIDSIAEFLGTGIENPDKNQTTLLYFQEPDYRSFMRDKDEINELKKSLIPRSGIPRLRFDYVIGNPPYISYNKSSQQGLESFKLIKQGKLKLNNIYGTNLHSVPGNPKRYRPNPNLFTFFIALGIALLKKNGKLSYIVPQTILVNPDFDVIRYRLSKSMTIHKIIIFKGKMFVGRGIKQKRAVPTSSLIFVVENENPSEHHEVEITIYNKIDDSLEKTFENISNGKNVVKKKILQNNLLENVTNWTFIKQDKLSIEFYNEYKKNSKDISEYYDHSISVPKFGDQFYFDGGYAIDEKKVLDSPNREISDYYRFPKLHDQFWSVKELFGYWPNIRSGNSKLCINLRQGNQEYKFLDSPYKLIWSYNNTTRFFFTDLPVIWARNKILGIGSKNKSELYYLFALLNSKVTSYLLRKFMKIEQEDTRTILVSLQIIKDQMRIPKINEGNQVLKNELIQRVKELINSEEKKLSDYVDFSKVLMQKVDNIKVDGNLLLLTKDKELLKVEIKSDAITVKHIIEAQKFSQSIPLTQIVNLPIIDLEKQRKLKDYIDDLVFALYFGIEIKKSKLNPSQVKKLCKKNKLYSLLEKLN